MQKKSSDKTMSELLAESGRAAGMLLATQGQIFPEVFVHGHEESHVQGLPYGGTAGDRYAIIKTLLVGQSLKLVSYAVLISEAWMAALPKGQVPGPDTRPASEDPNREEVVVAQVVRVGGETGSGMWRLKRDADGKNPRLGEAMHLRPGAEFKAQSWLDMAVTPEGMAKFLASDKLLDPRAGVSDSTGSMQAPAEPPEGK